MGVQQHRGRSSRRLYAGPRRRNLWWGSDDIITGSSYNDELRGDAAHRTSQYKNNVLEQDHRGVKGRYRPMRGFNEFGAAHWFCRAFDEVRKF